SSSSSASSSSSSSNDSPMAQSSPAWLSDVQPLSGNIKEYPSDASKIPTGPLSNDTNSQALQGYPPPSNPPPTNSSEVQAVIKAIDWSKVPKISQRKANPDGSVNMQNYNESDPDCWWSASGCVKPKYPGLPEDVYYCPTVGDWGLTYDDGPLTAEGGAAAEPELYNFLAQHQQKAALFYIGSNVISAPAAAQRGLANGHTLCSHTWSHPAMTSLSDDQVVAELYWSLRAIKHVTGVTVKCWRPPFGDVDDRVRAIAWQMGMRTILWDEDTNDWNMPGPGGGNLPPSTVDGYFEGWIQSRKNGTDNQHGHIILQHELNNATVSMAEKWLPKIKEVFRVVPFTQCMNISNPYWEENFVYPTDANPNGTSPAASPSQSPNAGDTSSHSAAPSSTTTPS
ncbi:glycoside hydrolase/deacetylase, partial [Lichtheimia hyalospora FSU 10163]